MTDEDNSNWDDLGIEASWAEQAERLKAVNRRLLVKLEEAKSKKADLVAAVYQAALDGISSLTMPKVPKPVPDRRRKGAETAIAWMSDWQLAKVTKSYNSQVCEDRIKLYGDKVVKLANVQRQDHPVRDLHLWLTGDLVEGELIFAGQEHLIDASLYRQVTVDGPRILVDFLLKMLANFDRIKVVAVIGNHGCATETARALTDRGFLHWDEIKPDDKVMSVDDDGNTVWQPIDEVVSFPYSGPMRRLSSRDYELTVTPDHRVVGLSDASRGWIEPTADALPHRMHVISSGTNTMPEYPISDDEIKLAVWMLTDSHRSDVRGSLSWHFYQSEPKQGRIKELLDSVGLTYSETARDRDTADICGKTLKSVKRSYDYRVCADSSRRIDSLIDGRRDRLPGWMFELSARQVDVLLDEWVYTDGTRPNGRSVCLYHSVHEEVRVGLQSILVGSGYKTSVSEYRPGHYRLNVVRQSTSGLNGSGGTAQVESTRYDGVVWCLRVPNGRFFVEDGGKVHLTGNSLGGPARRNYDPESNADRMLYRIVKQIMDKVPGGERIEWVIPDGGRERNWYAVDQIGSKRTLLLHGDQFRGGSGGMPWYSVAKKVGGWKMGAIEEIFDDVAFGHWHQPTRLTLNNVTARCSGSTESHNDFAQEMLAAVGRPSQWCMFANDEIGITAEYVVWLDV